MTCGMTLSQEIHLSSKKRINPFKICNRMKKEMLIAISLVLIMGASCSAPKKDNQKSTETVQASKPKQATVEEKTAQASETVKSGEKLYKDKGCLVCHQLNTKLVGPSIKDIAAAYSGNKAGLTAFLKGEGKAIVDPSQANVMQPQIAVTKALPTEELDAIADYILSFK